MRVLQLHCDEVEYKPIKKEIPNAEETSTETRIIRVCILLLISVEERDDDSVVEQCISAVEKAQAQLKCDSFVIYPYAHLSSHLASPKIAKEILGTLEKRVEGLGYSVHHVPFGWNKSLSIKVKGHPLAEQSKVFEPKIMEGEAPEKKEDAKEILSAALKAEDNLRSQWFIIDLEGNLTPISEYNFAKSKTLEKLKNYETAKVRAVQQIPPHVNFMKKLGLVDYEPASDPGNMRYYPKGRMIKSLLERYVTQRVQEYGGVEVETPIMYDLEHPSLASYLNRFPARQYLVKSDEKEYFLRFAACFGQFLIAEGPSADIQTSPAKAVRAH